MIGAVDIEHYLLMIEEYLRENEMPEYINFPEDFPSTSDIFCGDEIINLREWPEEILNAVPPDACRNIMRVIGAWVKVYRKYKNSAPREFSEGMAFDLGRTFGRLEAIEAINRNPVLAHTRPVVNAIHGKKQSTARSRRSTDAPMDVVKTVQNRAREIRRKDRDKSDWKIMEEIYSSADKQLFQKPKAKQGTVFSQLTVYKWVKKSH